MLGRASTGCIENRRMGEHTEQGGQMMHRRRLEHARGRCIVQDLQNAGGVSWARRGEHVSDAWMRIKIQLDTMVSD